MFFRTTFHSDLYEYLKKSNKIIFFFPENVFILLTNLQVTVCFTVTSNKPSQFSQVHFFKVEAGGDFTVAELKA